VVDAAGHTNVAITTTLFTGAFGQQDFIDRDHKGPNISISMEDHNLPRRRGKAAAVRVCCIGGRRSGNLSFLPR
jgi:hypothetical protein